jgi:hypothetical protein
MWRTMTQFENRIRLMVPDGEWWHRSGFETFAELGHRLLKLGLSHDDAMDFLESAYSAVANEYGN